MTDFALKHIFEKGLTGQPVLLLLHGTGGTERDLLDLAREIAPGAGLLGVRGNVLENGMPRFFKRIAEGVFDLEDLAARTTELAEFINAVKDRYGLHDTPLYALGYSNGANIATSLLLTYPHVVSGAILLRSMIPYDPGIVPDLTDKPILMLNGVMDPYVPVEQVQKLEHLLRAGEARLNSMSLPSGHELSQADIAAMRSWWVATTA